jgi:hypothetical protein
MARFKKWWTQDFNSEEPQHPNDIWPTWFIWRDRRGEPLDAQTFDVLVDVRNILLRIQIILFAILVVLL